MQQGLITTWFLPIALGVMMFGLGLGLRPADFKRVLVYPRAVAIGLICQIVVLPGICLGIAHGFGLPPQFAVGLMLLAASPGGAVANLFTRLARGDVALTITLTVVNSALSLVTLPLVVGFSMAHFLGASHSITVEPGKILSIVAVVLLPVAVGMIVRARQPALSDRLDRPLRLVATIFLFAVIIIAGLAERVTLGSSLVTIGPAAIAFNAASLGLGYFIPRLFGVERRQAIAIGMEIAIHNGTLSIAIALSVLRSPAMSLPAAVYSGWMLITAGAFAYAARRAGRRPRAAGLG